MQQTLFYIPLSLFQSPWLWLWATILVGLAIWQSRRTGLWDAALTWGVPLAILFALPNFIFPQVADWGIDPATPTQTINLGLAVRGYGLMMLLGIVSGVGLAIVRGGKEGIASDKIISLALTLAISGIIGARAFFVIQYWDSFAPDFAQGNLWPILNMTNGGLVVFGSFIGATIATLVWSRRERLSVLKLADIIAPSFVLGLALGRIGCLLNGCCFGGSCDLEALSWRFPAGSPPYQRQMTTGTVLGLSSSETPADEQAGLNDIFFSNRPPNEELNIWRTATDVPAGSAASVLGIEPGDVFFLEQAKPNLAGISLDKVLRAGKAGVKLPPAVSVIKSDGTVVPIPWDLLPSQSQGIHPTQIYSSLNAFLLTAVLVMFYPLRKFDGQTFAMMMILYAIARFLLEQIRQDEGGQFGTSLTISQWLSIVVFFCGIAFMIWGYTTNARRLPVGTAASA